MVWKMTSIIEEKGQKSDKQTQLGSQKLCSQVDGELWSAKLIKFRSVLFTAFNIYVIKVDKVQIF